MTKNWTRFFSFLLFALSVIAGVVLFEVVSKFAIGKLEGFKFNFENRYMLFKDEEGSSVFRNVDSFFTYYPNKKIQSTTYYYVDSSWIKEYDYIIPTNNLGLVQVDPTLKHRKSLLLLGDSYTEGQGSYPWFENFKSFVESKGLQPINGGLMGTGFQQWRLLHEYIENNDVDIEYLVVVFLSHDVYREIWNVDRDVRSCIVDYQKCAGGESFYGKAPPDKLVPYLDSLKIWRENLSKFFAAAEKSKRESSFEYWLAANTRKFIPATSSVVAYVYNSISVTKDEAAGKALLNEEASLKVVSDLIEQYGNNVLFVHLPSKDEIFDNRVLPIGLRAVDHIKALKGNYFSGHKLCNFSEDDFLVNDGHPNKSGYKKISNCVTDAIKGTWELN